MLTILIGVSGSGKSTAASRMMGETCEADSYPGLYQRGQLQPHVLKQAHQACQQQVESYMKLGMPIIQSNTNLDEQTIRTYRDLAKRNKYQVSIEFPPYDLLYFPHTMSREEQIQHLIRVRAKGDKIVPESAIRRMVASFDSIRKLLI